MAYVLAGPPGAGKSTVVDDLLGVDHGQFVVVDPDVFKSSLLRQAVEDASFDEVIKPPEVKELEALGEQFFPLEFAALVHEESSRLAHMVHARAAQQGLNLVIDGVLANTAKATELCSQLEACGYVIHVVNVEIPYDVCERRVEERWREAYRAALADPQAALGGRWVPSEYARSVFIEAGTSRCEEAARNAAEASVGVVEYRRYLTTSDADGPVLVEHRRRASPEAELSPV